MTPAPCIKHPKPFWPWDRGRMGHYLNPDTNKGQPKWLRGWVCPICQRVKREQREAHRRKSEARSMEIQWNLRNREPEQMP